MILVTNSAWSPILLRAEGMPIKRSAIGLAAYNFGSLFGSAVAGFLVTRFGPVRVLPLTLAGGPLPMRRPAGPPPRSALTVYGTVKEVAGIVD